MFMRGYDPATKGASVDVRALVIGMFSLVFVHPASAQDPLEGTYRLRRWEFGPSHHLHVKVWVSAAEGKLTLTRQVGRDSSNVRSALIERVDGGRIRARFQGGGARDVRSAVVTYSITPDGAIQGTFEATDAAGVTTSTQESGVRVKPEPLPATKPEGPTSLTLQLLAALQVSYGKESTEGLERALTLHYVTEAAKTHGQGPLSFVEEELVAIVRANPQTAIDLARVPRVKEAIDAKVSPAGQPGALAGVSVEALCGVFVSQVRAVNVECARSVAQVLVDTLLPIARRDPRNSLPIRSGPTSFAESQLIAVLEETPEVAANTNLADVPWVRLATQGKTR